MHVTAVLLIVSFALLLLLDLSPGDPALAVLGENPTKEQIAQVREQLGLNDSVPTRYLNWLDDLVHGDFGTSYVTRQKVTDVIAESLPVTAELIILAILMALAVSIPLGVYTAYKADGRFDRIWQSISSVILSIPPFVSALILVYFFALQLKDFPIHFPVTGWVNLTDNVASNLWYVFLPALTLALVEIPQYSRLVRADMIATLQEDYILAARAKGLPIRRILYRHALRPSSFSLVTLAALSTGRLIGGAVIVESLFALPGLGEVLRRSIFDKDIPQVQGLVMFIAFVYVLMNVLLDLIYHLLDPRVRTQRAAA